MIATLLLLFASLDGGPGLAAPPPSWAYQAASLSPLPASSANPAVAASPVITYYAFLPLAIAPTSGCEPIPGVSYGTLDVEGPPSDRPPEQHPDLNLALRGYEPSNAHLGLVDYGGGADPRAPQLYALFADHRVPTFAAVYQVYDWDWSCDCRGSLLTNWEVTLAGLGMAPGEVVHLPDSGYDIGDGYEALVLYATEERLTLKYTREDHVVFGYTIHLEGICVEPSLLALYRAWNDAGRAELPALRGGQPLGRARGREIGVAIRDTGTFMDPRSRRDWWQTK